MFFYLIESLYESHDIRSQLVFPVLVVEVQVLEFLASNGVVQLCVRERKLQLQWGSTES